MSRIDIRTERVYLAGRFDRRGEFKRYVDMLEGIGIESMSRWITDEPDISTIPEIMRAKYREQWAINDVQDVLAADTFLCFSEDQNDPLGVGEGGMFINGVPAVPVTWSRGGRHVEFGIAATQGHRIVILGPRENIFHWLPQCEQYDTFDEWFEIEKGSR